MFHYGRTLESRAIPTSYSQAFSLAPSAVWDGNDGGWSTFVIRVGTPAQYFRILPSTNGEETWVPIPDHCEEDMARCGNARGVEPFNAATSGPSSGSPIGMNISSIDAGVTCTANRSPMCINCISVNGACTNGPCTGRQCCGNPMGVCNSGGCNGISGICTDQYIGCPCSGPDWNAASGVMSVAQAPNPLAALGFQANLSTTWSSEGNYSLAVQNYSSNAAIGQYGIDTVGLGDQAATGLTVTENVVAGVLSEPSYIGKLGLKASNSTALNFSSASFIMQLKNQNQIPSLSYGYTAGALYHQPPLLGSLTLGGYDAARSSVTNLTAPLAGNDTNTVMVGIQSISVVNSLVKTANLLPQSVFGAIDTTLPYVSLPASACRAFEAAFGLLWDPTQEIYLLNDTVHQQLQNLNPSVSFTLTATNIPSSSSVNITLPYGAFDLQAAAPIYPNGTNYFPLRRATEPNQYTLGRAFMQEAYLFVDYEKSQFSLSQAQFPLNTTTNIITVSHSQTIPTKAPSSPTSNSPHLSKGAIAGIAIAGSAALVFLSILIFLIFRRHRRNVSSSNALPRLSPKTEKDTSSSPTTSSGSPALARSTHNPFNQIPSTSPPPSSSKQIQPELEDPTSPLAKGQPRNLYTVLDSKSKPLPRTPQELVGCDVAREAPPDGSPRSPGSARKARHIYELQADEKWIADRKR